MIWVVGFLFLSVVWLWFACMAALSQCRELRQQLQALDRRIEEEGIRGDVLAQTLREIKERP